MGFLDKMKSSVSGVSAQQRYASNIRKLMHRYRAMKRKLKD